MKLLLLTTLLSTTAQAASPYDACIQGLVKGVLDDTRLNVQESTINDYGHSTYLSTIVQMDRNGKWPKPGKASSKGRSAHNFRVSAKTDRTSLTFGFSARLFEVVRSEFGSGESKKAIECCILESSVKVKDGGSGLAKEFRPGSICRSYLDEEEGVVSKQEQKTGLCAEFGKKAEAWSTTKEWDYEKKTPTECSDGSPNCEYRDMEYYKTFKSHKGCRVTGGNVETEDFEESLL